MLVVLSTADEGIEPHLRTRPPDWWRLGLSPRSAVLFLFGRSPHSAHQMGFLQFLSPTISFIIGTVQGESLTPRAAAVVRVHLGRGRRVRLRCVAAFTRGARGRRALYRTGVGLAAL